MNFKNDKRVVLTLDAGGTNFVFSAMQGGKEIVDAIAKPSNASDLDKCLATIVDGFQEVKDLVKADPIAISFAFPGPADYPNGIIGDLPNFPAFKGGVALGPYLNRKFDLPVYINNDGDLFAYGEALVGALPKINDELKLAGSSKQYKNLIALTIGTGLGGGVVIDNKLLVGDNSISTEVWLMSNRVQPKYNAEEVVSTRSIIAEYKKETNSGEDGLMPLDIYEIAKGRKPGNVDAAIKAFEFFGRGIGDVIANLITLFDGIVVLGGGITGAEEYYMPAVFAELEEDFIGRSENTSRPVQMVFNYSDEKQKTEFLKSYSKEISIPCSSETITYDPIPRVAVAHSQMGASEAIQVGAYVFALNELN